MFNQIISAIKAYGKAVNLIIAHNLWLYFIYPVIICVALYMGGILLIREAGDYLQTHIISYFHLDNDNTSTTMYLLSAAIRFIIWIGLEIIFFFAYSSVIRNLILIVLSPVLARLSEKTDELLTGKQYPFRFWQLMKDMLRGSLIALRNLLIQTGLILICFLLMFIPIVGWLAPVFLPLINYYFYGFSMLDYSNERYRLGVRDSVRFIRKNKGLAIGNGFIFSAIFAVPYAGVVIAPILAVVAGTIVSIEARQNTKDQYGKN